MPVVKNDWDIYNSKRGRRVSECSNPQNCGRSRKVSETKSEGPSLSTSPGNDFQPPPSNYKSSSNMSKQNSYSRASSRTSEASLQSPIKSSSSSPPKSDSSTSLNNFHCRLLDKLKKSLKNKDGDSEKTSWRVFTEETPPPLLKDERQTKQRLCMFSAIFIALWYVVY